MGFRAYILQRGNRSGWRVSDPWDHSMIQSSLELTYQIIDAYVEVLINYIYMYDYGTNGEWILSTISI